MDSKPLTEAAAATPDGTCVDTCGGVACSGIVPVDGDELCQSSELLCPWPSPLPDGENPLDLPGLNAPDVDGDGMAGGGGRA